MAPDGNTRPEVGERLLRHLFGNLLRRHAPSAKTGEEETRLEIIIIGDTGWTRIDGGVWTKVEDANKIEDISEPPLPGLPNLEIMTLQGTETVNGIKCKHYTRSGGSIEEDIWVADQAGLPPILIRKREKQQAPPIEDLVDVTDVNKSISITPPQDE